MNNIQHQQQVQKATKKAFGRKKTLKGKTTTRYPASAEREYIRLTRQYMKLADDMLDKELPIIIKEYRRGSRTDARFDGTADFKQALECAFLKMNVRLAKKLEKFGLTKKLKKLSRLVRKSALREWKRACKRTLNIDVDEKHYNESFYGVEIDAWISNNLLKVSNLPSDALRETKELLIEEYDNGTPLNEAAEKVKERRKADNNYAACIAASQIALLFAQMTKRQQQDAGVTSYVWQSTGDERVRECHRTLNGNIFKWDEPPEMWYTTVSRGVVRTGRHCNPGEDYMCRCCAVPVFDKTTLNIPIENETRGS